MVKMGTSMYGSGFGFSDNGKRGRHSLIKPTVFLVAVNVSVYVYTSLAGGSFIQTGDDVLTQLGQYNLYVFAGRYWQLLTSMFVHVDIMHIGLNMFFLLIFGLRVEDFFTSEEYFAVYLLSGLAGNILTLFFLPIYTVSAGASGAIFGIYGAGIIYMQKAYGQSIVVALFFAFLFLMLSTGVGVNIVAHFGGLAVGLIIGYVLAESHRQTY